MKKLNVRPNLLKVLKEIISEKPHSQTKFARVIVELAERGRAESDYLKPNEQVDFISISRKQKDKLRYMRPKNLIKFIEQQKEEKGEDVEITPELIYLKAVPTTSKPTTFLKRVLRKEVYKSLITQRDQEYFSYQMRAKFTDLEYKIVEGEELREFYKVENYAENDGSNGTLHSSCMATRTHHLDLLVNNPKSVKMLVALKEDSNGREKVVARALLWDNVTFKNRGVKGKLMDRIYYIKDFMVENFKNWAIAHDYFYKNQQSHSAYTQFTSPKGETFHDEIFTKIENISFQKYPYLDTLFRPNWGKKLLTNYVGTGDLRDYSNGTAPYYWDEVDNKQVDSNGVWSEIHKTWINIRDVQRMDQNVYHKSACKPDGFGGFIIPDEKLEKCVITGKEFSPRYAVYSKFHKGKIHQKVSKKVGDTWAHKDYVVKSKHFNSDIFKDDAIKIGDDYIPGEFAKFGINEKNGLEFVETVKKYKSFDLDSFEEELELNFD